MLVYPSNITQECSEGGDGKDEGNARSNWSFAIVTRDSHSCRITAHTSTKVAAEGTDCKLDSSAVGNALVTGELGGRVEVPHTVVHLLLPRTRHVNLVVVAQNVVVECGPAGQAFKRCGRGDGLVVRR